MSAPGQVPPAPAIPPASAVPPAPAVPLTALREDLRLQRGAPGGDGLATWLLYDPVAHRYYELEPAGIAILRAWREGADPAEVAAAAGTSLGRAVDLPEVEAFRRFAERHGLVRHRGGWQALACQAAARETGWAGWLLHNYLFVRVPLVRPQRVLLATLPLARRLADRRSLAAVALAGLLGIVLVSRQWDAFTSTFLHFLSVEGLAGYLAALALVKVAHELGHAYAAVNYGCRVSSMGVAFMVMMPVLYTDTTDAWRLRDRRQRLAIDGAGIAVELAVAALATLAWSFLPEGPGRSVAFFLATTSWTLSLAINLSPFMRFDGYYLAGDLFGISNLQPRAFALTRWALRETLFGLGDPCPEPWRPRRRALVAAYGAAVCLYRLVVFTGIALLVYGATFKLLGILLFAVEIGVFVLRPIVLEARVWWRERARIAGRPRARATFGIAAAAVLLFVLPVSGRVEIPAIAEPVRTERLTAAAAARVESLEVSAGDRVVAGQVMMRLASPRLDHDVESARIRLALTEMKLARRASDAFDRGASLVLDGESASGRETLAGLERSQQQLVIRAPFDGIVAELEPDLQPGRWVGRGEELGTAVSAGGRQVRGLAAEDGIARLHTGAFGTFVPDDPMAAAIPLRLASVSRAAIATVEIPALASTLGGPVSVREEKGVGPVPVEARYVAVLTPLDDPAPDYALRLSGRQEGAADVVRGVVTVAGTRESLAAGALRRIAAVLLRESGF